MRISAPQVFVFQALLFGVAFDGPARAETIVHGMTSFCRDGKEYHPPKVDVYFFETAKAQSLAPLLEELKNRELGLRYVVVDAASQANTHRFFEVYNQMVKLARVSKPLARTKSNTTGAFSVTISSNVRTLLVLGISELEDEPYFYAYAPVNIGNGSKQNAVVLDFSRVGDCAAARSGK